MCKKLVRHVVALSLLSFVALPALGQDTEGAVSAPMPRSMAQPLRIIPVAGASSFTTANKVDVNNFGDGFSAGLLADMGPGTLTFETGILTLSTQTDRQGDTRAFDIQNWGIPLLAKVNFSGKPHETVFLKAGAMPFTVTGDVDRFEVMAVGGIGGHIPLGKNSSILLDATYNRLFRTSGELSNYQGITLLAGLSLNI